MAEAEKVEIKPLTFNIYKRSQNADGTTSELNGVTIKVSAVSNCTIDGATNDVLEMKSNNNDGKKGWFGNIKINPSEKKGTCTIRITEEQPANHYAISTTDLTITHGNTELGKIDNITFNKNSDNFVVTRHESPYVTSISLINDPRVTNLTIEKTDKNGSAKLSNAEFQLYLDNVESLKIGDTTINLSDIPVGDTGKKYGTVTLKRNLKNDAGEY